MLQILISFISASTALIATIIGPLVALKTAQRQFNANVLSTNRAKWIETMRELIASVVSQMTVYVMMRGHLQEMGTKNFAANPELLTRIERGTQTISMIRLMINPNEPDNLKLMETLDGAFHCLRSQNDQAQVEEEIRKYTEEILIQGRAILRREWLRVKEGT